MKLCNWQIFDLKSSYHAKQCLNFKILKFELFKRPRMEKTTKTNFVDLEKLRNIELATF